MEHDDEELSNIYYLVYFFKYIVNKIKILNSLNFVKHLILLLILRKRTSFIG